MAKVMQNGSTNLAKLCDSLSCKQAKSDRASLTGFTPEDREAGSVSFLRFPRISATIPVQLQLLQLPRSLMQTFFQACLHALLALRPHPE